jgi:hypothetical protein
MPLADGARVARLSSSPAAIDGEQERPLSELDHPRRDSPAVQRTAAQDRIRHSAAAPVSAPGDGQREPVGRIRIGGDEVRRGEAAGADKGARFTLRLMLAGGDSVSYGI